MSFKASKWAYGLQGLTPSEKSVLLALAFRADEYDKCFPGQTLLAKDTSLHRVTISNILNKLVDDGFITSRKRKKNGLQKSNEYHLNVDIIITKCSPTLHLDVAPDYISCSPTLHDYVAPDYMTCSPTLHYETSIETSVESSVESSVAKTSSLLKNNMDFSLETKEKEKEEKEKKEGEKEEEKNMSFSKDVDQILKSHSEKPKVNPEQAIASCKMKNGIYSGQALGKLWESLRIYHLSEVNVKALTGKNCNQLKMAGKAAGDAIREIINVCMWDWVGYVIYVREVTDKAGKPELPDVGYFLTHIQEAHNFYVLQKGKKVHVQSIAQPLIHKLFNKGLLPKVEKEKQMSNEDLVKLFEDM